MLFRALASSLNQDYAFYLLCFGLFSVLSWFSGLLSYVRQKVMRF